MTRQLFFVLLFVLGAFFSEASLAEGPVLVELYTSEGCSSCPPAEDFLNSLDKKARAQNKPLYVLAYHVDYWNNLGWIDRFSQRQFSERQRNMARRLSDGVYTPQMVIDGRTALVGSHRNKANKAISKAERVSKKEISVKVQKQGSTIKASANIKGAATYVLVMNDLKTKVKSGENRGLTLVHRGVVKALKKSSSGEVSFKIPKESAGDLSVVVFVENKGVVEAAGRADL